MKTVELVEQIGCGLRPDRCYDREGPPFIVVSLRRFGGKSRR
jgi:hypothetical protein